MARVVMAALGSMGDVFPVLGMAQAMVQRGHDVTVVTTHNFASEARSTGARHLPVGEPGAYQQAIERMDVRRRFQAMTLGIGNLLAKVEPVHAAVASCKPDLVVANSLSVGAAVAAEEHRIPWCSVVSQTVMMRSLVQPPRYNLADLQRAPTARSMRRRYAWTDLALDVLLARPINRFRRQRGLPAISWRRDPYAFLSPRRILLTWPGWFSPTQPEWPAQARHAGFVMFDAPAAQPSAAWQAALSSVKSKPLVFTPGSWTTHGQRFFDVAIRASQQLGRPAILLTSHVAQLPPLLPEGIVHVDYAPMSQLLPHCAAVIHHGGPGTAAHGLAAGIPQLSLPQMFDQFDNTHHLVRLGVGNTMPDPRYGSLAVPPVAEALQALLSSSTVATRCQEHAAVMKQFFSTAEVLEGVLQSADAV